MGVEAGSCDFCSCGLLFLRQQGATKWSSRFLMGPGHVLPYNPVLFGVNFTFTYSQTQDVESSGWGGLISSEKRCIWCTLNHEQSISLMNSRPS